MRQPMTHKSTNVRSVLLAVSLWSGFVASLAWGGALERLRDDVPALAVFAGFAASLAYAVDEEVRACVDGIRAGMALPAWCVLAAALATGGDAATLLASPLAAVVSIALARRAAALSSTAAALPGATRAALSAARSSARGSDAPRA